MDNGQLEGLKVPSEKMHLLHGFYANDINLTIKATPTNILYCKHLFMIFGNAFGLHCNWASPKAVFISKRPLPNDL